MWKGTFLAWPLLCLKPPTLLGSGSALAQPGDVALCSSGFLERFSPDVGMHKCHLNLIFPKRFSLGNSRIWVPSFGPLPGSMCLPFSSQHVLENGLVYLFHSFPVGLPLLSASATDKTLSVLFCLVPEREQALAHGSASNIC